MIMDLKLDISPKLIKSIVSVYTDINRVFMEYIDNSIDNAEQFFDKITNSYTKLIEIKIWFHGSTHKDSMLKVEDNCAGIDDISKITASLGDSDKANNTFLNGQFGFGVYSFMAVCNTLKISTKVKNNQKIKTIELKSDLFDKSKTDDVNLGSILEAVTKSQNSWTVVVLSDFKKDKFKEISINEIRKEIEKHFEVILSRGNIKISIQKGKNKSVECKPFNYSTYNGSEFKKEINTLYCTNSKKYSTLKEIDIKYTPVTIYLKVTKDKAIDRKPFFVIKGRRIADISDIKAFRTYSKGLIWSHPNVTGYVDVTGCLEPTIARNEIKNTQRSKALFQTLLKYEDDIKKFVEDNLNRITTHQFKRLESILNKAVSDLLNESEIEKRRTLSKVRLNNIDTITNTGYETTKKFTITSQEDDLSDNVKNVNNAASNLSNTALAKKSLKREPPSYTYEIPVKAKKTKNQNTSGNGESVGINIQIDHENDPLKDRNNKSLRSILFESYIVIYKKHPEFMKRLNESSHGIPKISSSLITYLCCEILIHFKSINKFSKDESVDKKILFNDFLESLYLLENKLSGLKNKKLSEFS